MLVIAVCQFGAELFIARQYLLAQIFVTPLALISTLLVAPAAPGILLRDRIVETVIGAAVGIAVVLAPGSLGAGLTGGLQRPPRPHADVQRRAVARNARRRRLAGCR